MSPETAELMMARMRGDRPKPRNRCHQISREKRCRIYARDRYTCQECGSKDHATLTLDHIVPSSKGGTNSYDNLRTLCRPCNEAKADKG